MDELVKLVSQKTGLSEAQAKVAVDTVVGYLKQKLPAPVAGQIDGILSGAGGGGALGDQIKGIGKMLGKK